MLKSFLMGGGDVTVCKFIGLWEWPVEKGLLRRGRAGLVE